MNRSTLIQRPFINSVFQRVSLRSDQPSHHVVVPVLWLEHEDDLLQALCVAGFRTLGWTEYGDDALSDVGEINLLQFGHDGCWSHGLLADAESERLRVRNREREVLFVVVLKKKKKHLNTVN